MTAPPRTMRILLVEDVEDDAELVIAEVRRGGYAPQWRRVESRAGIIEALEAQQWDAVICDYKLPDFDAPGALSVLQERGVDLPFIIISGQVGEDAAVRAMKAGAHDFLFKGLLKRLVPALEREIRDAGARREQLAERLRAQSQLLISDRMASVGTLAAGVAHEINNPLTVVLANLDFLDGELREVVAKDPEVGAALRDARDAAGRVRDIVRDLKIFSRSKEDQVAPEPVDVHAVLDSAVRMAWNQIRHRAKLVKNYDQVPRVLGTDARLGQVFLNLIVNAAQAIPDGHAEVNEIRLGTVVRPDGRVAITVSDTGPGMPPEVMRRLFTPFFTTKEVGMGTGLGLSISHRIVTAFGGDIEVESAPGAGTRFCVILPPAEGRDATAAGPVSPAVITARARILVIDDEPAVASSIKRLLSPSHDVSSAKNGRHALDRIRTGDRFDVILCDVMMPELSGQQVHVELSRIAPDQAARMVFVTGGAFTPEAIAFLQGFEGAILDKPFNPDELRAMVMRRLTI